MGEKESFEGRMSAMVRWVEGEGQPEELRMDFRGRYSPNDACSLSIINPCRPVWEWVGSPEFKNHFGVHFVNDPPPFDRKVTISSLSFIISDPNDFDLLWEGMKTILDPHAIAKEAMGL